MATMKDFVSNAYRETLPDPKFIEGWGLFYEGDKLVYNAFQIAQSLALEPQISGFILEDKYEKLHVEAFSYEQMMSLIQHDDVLYPLANAIRNLQVQKAVLKNTVEYYFKEGEKPQKAPEKAGGESLSKELVLPVLAFIGSFAKRTQQPGMVSSLFGGKIILPYVEDQTDYYKNAANLAAACISAWDTTLVDTNREWEMHWQLTNCFLVPFMQQLLLTHTVGGDLYKNQVIYRWKTNHLQQAAIVLTKDQNIDLYSKNNFMRIGWKVRTFVGNALYHALYMLFKREKEKNGWFVSSAKWKSGSEFAYTPTSGAQYKPASSGKSYESSQKPFQFFTGGYKPQQSAHTKSQKEHTQGGYNSYYKAQVPEFPEEKEEPGVNFSNVKGPEDIKKAFAFYGLDPATTDDSKLKRAYITNSVSY
jgi:hypothetical protein